jgi:hypothetical protein
MSEQLSLPAMAAPAAPPAPAKRPRKKPFSVFKAGRGVTISFTVDEDMARAIQRYARDTMMVGSRATAVRLMVRTHLVNSPEKYQSVPFPFEQSMELWVWANQEARDRNEHPVNPRETLVASRDGERVVRLDWTTAA